MHTANSGIRIHGCVCLCVDITHLGQFLALLSLHNPFMCGISLRNQSLDQSIDHKTMHYVFLINAFCINDSRIDAVHARRV